MAKLNQTPFAQTNPGDAWIGDFSEDRAHLLPGGIQVDPAQFNAIDAVVVVVDVAGAAGNATSVPVLALSGPIPAGTVLTFGAANSKKFAKLTVAAAAGATTLTTEQIPTALVSTDTATYPGVGLKRIPSGTLLGRTYAERDAGTPFGPAVTASDDQQFLLAHDIADADDDNEGEAYRPGGLVKENFLPGWATLPGATQTKIRALYQCINGKD